MAVLLCALLAGCAGSVESRTFADIIRGAQSAELNVTKPPAQYLSNGVADLQPLLDRTLAELSRYYAGDLLAQTVSRYQAEIRSVLSTKSGGRVGGVTSVELKDVTLSGRTARVKARVTVWFKTAQFWWQDPGARPSASNVMDLDLHLVQDGGRWKIDQEISQFAPGGGP